MFNKFTYTPDHEKQWQALDRQFGPLKEFQETKLQSGNQDWDKGPVFEPKEPELSVSSKMESQYGWATAYGTASLYKAGDALVGYSDSGGMLEVEHKPSGKKARLEGGGRCVVDQDGARCQRD